MVYIIKTGGDITTMDEMDLAGKSVKNAYQELYIELKEDYGLSQIEVRALIGTCLPL